MLIISKKFENSQTYRSGNDKKIWTQNFIPHKVYATGNIDLPCIDKQGKIYQLEILIRNYNHFPLMTTFFIVLFSLKLLADTKKLQKSL